MGNLKKIVKGEWDYLRWARHAKRDSVPHSVRNDSHVFLLGGGGREWAVPTLSHHHPLCLI